MADGIHRVADAHAPTEDRWHDDLRELVGHEHRDVVLRLRALDAGGRSGAVGEGHGDRAAAADDVVGGEDRALRADDDARPQALRSRIASPANGFDDDEARSNLGVCRAGG